MSATLPPGWKPPVERPESLIPAAIETPRWQRVHIYRLQLLGDPVLKEQCEPFDPARDAGHLPALINVMSGIVQRFGGWGISAPQVGAAVQVVIARLDGRLTGPLSILINPAITKRSFDMALMVEGCLSIPRFESKVLRHKRVTVDYFDEQFETQTVELAGYPAQVLQHEVDHLDGMLLTDRVGAKKRAIAEKLVAKARGTLGL